MFCQAVFYLIQIFPLHSAADSVCIELILLTLELFSKWASIHGIDQMAQKLEIFHLKGDVALFLMKTFIYQILNQSVISC